MIFVPLISVVVQNKVNCNDCGGDWWPCGIKWEREHFPHYSYAGPSNQQNKCQKWSRWVLGDVESLKKIFPHCYHPCHWINVGTLLSVSPIVTRSCSSQRILGSSPWICIQICAGRWAVTGRGSESGMPRAHVLSFRRFNLHKRLQHTINSSSTHFCSAAATAAALPVPCIVQSFSTKATLLSVIAD